MYYKEKKTIASIFSGILILFIYGYYTISKYLEVGDSLLDNLKFWGSSMLVAIGGGIIVTIIIQIVFHILLAISSEVSKEIKKAKNPDDKLEEYDEYEMSDVEDEMDKLIELKSVRNSFVFVGIGFVISIIALYLEKPPAITMNIIFISFNLGSIFEGFSKLYFYKRGVRNG